MPKVFDKTVNRRVLNDGAGDEILKTYFKSSSKGANSSKKKNRSKALPWLIAGAAVCLALGIFISRSKLNVTVRILGEVPSLQDNSLDQSRFGVGHAKGILFLKTTEVNRQFVKKTYFAGDAVHSSSINDKGIVIYNQKGIGWANFTLELRDTIDLNGFEVRYAASGARGGEYLIPVLVDSDNRSYRPEKDDIFRLADTWNVYSVDAERFGGAVDISRISAIRFEAGSLTAGNSSSSAVLLKDIGIVKKRKAGWL